ncbi:MAG: copper amine oxidase N-terminal domain-containing protein, partial [Anaerotignum sp.]
KEGAVAKITVKAKKNGTGTFADTAAAVEVAKVVGEGIVIEVDEDEDVPEMWSGVAADTSYLTDDDDNTSLEFTIKETVKGAYSEKDAVELVLPEGVYVVGDDGVDISVEGGDNGLDSDDWTDLFEAAYQEGDHETFKFKRRTIAETTDEAFEINVKLTLVADPDFVGDVDAELIVGGDSVGKVTIATFKAPLAVEAQQNDLIIDYRNTEVPTDIVVKEAEAGLWKEGMVIGFGIDRFDDDCFEDDMVYTVNEDESGMEITGEDDYLEFEVDEESDDEAAVVTISNISLYMSRNLAAGSYDLTIYSNAYDEYNKEVLFAPDTHTDWDAHVNAKCDDECFVDDVCDYSDVVKEGFINIITAGRDQDDASFTKKVVVPVGENYIVAGEETVTLDVPAYISAAGYTMLPVRAVAVALGINNNNVLWDQATKTVTILYGQRIITMSAGQKVVYVNGSAIPASASVEIKDGRTFLPMRDLATALGVTDITWDAATKTATLNGNK